MLALPVARHASDSRASFRRQRSAAMPALRNALSNVSIVCD